MKKRSFKDTVLDADLGKLHIFSVGQAGFIIKNKKGELLGIDLYLSNCVEQIEGHCGFKRLLPQIMDAQDIEFDYLVATHSHYDHFDRDSMKELLNNKKTKLFASYGCEQEINVLAIETQKVCYVKPNDYEKAGDFELHIVSCDHGSAAPDAFGLVIRVDDKNIFVAGDTCLRLDRVGEYIAHGEIDILIAPINGAYGNLNELECVQLSKAIAPGLVIPCHYGMFASHGGNPGVFLEEMKKSCPESKYLLMAQGEEYIFE